MEPGGRSEYGTGALPHAQTPSPDYQRDLDAGIDYIELLGVAEEAEAAEVVSAFRRKVRAVHPDGRPDGGDPEQVALLARARSTLTGPEREAYLGGRKFHQIQRELEETRRRRDAAARPRHWSGLDFERVAAEARAELEIEEARQAALERQLPVLDEESVEAELQSIADEAEADYLRVVRTYERRMMRALYGSDPEERPEDVERRTAAAMRAVDRWVNQAVQDLQRRATRGRSPNG